MIPRPIRSAAAALAGALLLAAPAAAQEEAEQDSQRPAPPAQRPAQDSARVTLGERTPTYDWKARSRYFLQAIPVFPADSSDAVTVRVSRLRGRSGEEIRVRAWFGTDTTRRTAVAKPLLPAMLRLEATLPDTGEYRGTFTLTSPGRQATTGEFRVTYTSADTVPGALEVRGTGPVAATLGFFSFGARRWAAVTIPFTVVDSGRGAAMVRRPELESFARNAVGDTAVQVDFREVKVLDTNGDPLPAEFKLVADESRRLRLRISGIRTPGRYSGNVRVAGKDLDPVVTPVTVYVRRSGWLAMLLIALGVLISGAIRYYQQRVRPRLLRQRRAAELLEWLGTVERQLATTGGMTAEETAVAAKLRADLERIYDTAGDSVAADDAGAAATAVSARLDLATARLELLPDWVNARRQIDAVKMDDIRRDLSAKLAPVREALYSGTAEEVKEAGDTVRGIPAAIIEAVGKRLVDEIGTFADEVTEARKANPTDDEFLRSMEAEVQDRLTAAKDAAEHGRLEEAAAGFDRARVAYADLLAKELRIRLGEPAPGWMQAADWTAMETQVEAALDRVPLAQTSEARIKAFNEALGLYLSSMATAMGGQAVKDAARPGVTDEQKASLKEIADQAVSVGARVAAEDVHGASTLFTAAEKAYRELIPNLPKPKGGRMGGPAAAAASASAGAAAAVGGVPGAIGAAGGAVLVAPEPIRRLGARQIEALIRTRDLWISVAVALIAVVLGVSLLWAESLTWGSWKDLITAIVWGLGLHQVGTSGAGGTGGILAGIVGKETNAPG